MLIPKEAMGNAPYRAGASSLVGADPDQPGRAAKEINVPRYQGFLALALGGWGGCWVGEGPRRASILTVKVAFSASGSLVGERERVVAPPGFTPPREGANQIRRTDHASPRRRRGARGPSRKRIRSQERRPRGGASGRWAQAEYCRSRRRRCNF